MTIRMRNPTPAVQWPGRFTRSGDAHGMYAASSVLCRRVRNHLTRKAMRRASSLESIWRRLRYDHPHGTPATCRYRTGSCGRRLFRRSRGFAGGISAGHLRHARLSESGSSRPAKASEGQALSFDEKCFLGNATGNESVTTVLAKRHRSMHPTNAARQAQSRHLSRFFRGITSARCMPTAANSMRIHRKHDKSGSPFADRRNYLSFKTGA